MYAKKIQTCTSAIGALDEMLRSRRYRSDCKKEMGIKLFICTSGLASRSSRKYWQITREIGWAPTLCIQGTGGGGVSLHVTQMAHRHLLSSSHRLILVWKRFRFRQCCVWTEPLSSVVFHFDPSTVSFVTCYIKYYVCHCGRS
jgi:hypothetical protein